MHVDVVHIRLGWSLIRLSAKPSESHLMQIDSQRTHAIQEHIDPQVVL